MSLRFVHSKSVNDCEFGSCISSHVSNKEFYASAWILEKGIWVQYGGNGKSGNMVIASQKTIKAYSDEVAGAAQEKTEKDYTTAIKSWFVEFQKIEKNPLEKCKEMGFNLVMSWGSSFYSLKPIVHTVYLERLVIRLVNSGVQVMSLDELIKLGVKGLMACSCSCFLHRAWCIHAWVIGRKRGILDFPLSMNPCARSGNQGRPSRAAIIRLMKFEDSGGQLNAWIGGKDDGKAAP